MDIKLLLFILPAAFAFLTLLIPYLIQGKKGWFAGGAVLLLCAYGIFAINAQIFLFCFLLALSALAYLFAFETIGRQQLDVVQSKMNEAQALANSEASQN